MLKWYGKLLAVALFAVIGGALGSVVTWVLYGFSFGQGISAPLANMLFSRLKFSEFSAQFTADMGIDIADKLVTVLVLVLALNFLPKSFLEKLPLGYIYKSEKTFLSPAELRELDFEQLREERLFRKHSIRTKITTIIVVSATVLSAIALTISTAIYKSKLTEQYTQMCSDSVSIMLSEIDGDRIGEYLEKGAGAEGYLSTEKELSNILENSDELKYMYVYSIRPDGCHVVFDLDTDELEGETAGTVIGFDESFPYIEEAIAGEEIPPLVTDDTYGWLLTVYKPVTDSTGNVAAYAAADIDMQEIKTNIYSFCISIGSLLFGALIVISAFALWYCDSRLLDPMSVLVEQARDFDFDGRAAGSRVRDSRKVTTGDELEEVFGAMCKTEDAIAGKVAELKEKNLEISHMQRNIIYTLANMVENRDENTGGHIKRTAGYVKLLGEKLKEKGIYPETEDEGYIKKLFDSAPLHDIGKVKIPDAVLNKPGRLTEEEFEIMKTHTTEGAAILRTSLSEIEDGSWLSTAIDMALSHHERWDGSGYPNGLSGEEIPLCARIMAVSDVFDALVSERSYKRAFSFEEAMRIIKEGAGTQFDPQIVKIFEESEKEVLEIKSIK